MRKTFKFNNYHVCRKAKIRAVQLEWDERKRGYPTKFQLQDRFSDCVTLWYSPLIDIYYYNCVHVFVINHNYIAKWWRWRSRSSCWHCHIWYVHHSFQIATIKKKNKFNWFNRSFSSHAICSIFNKSFFVGSFSRWDRKVIV